VGRARIGGSDHSFLPILFGQRCRTQIREPALLRPSSLRLAVLPAVLLATSIAARPAHAQCILANPSFEVAGSAGRVFGGWNQFGAFGSTPNATHGAVAARVSGPNTGGWDLSGYWQQLACAPGRRWSATVRGWHSAPRSLTGQSRAVLNIEWRNSSGGLISYESHDVADASTPLDVVQEFSVESLAAPSGTAAVRLVLGVLQSPTDPVPDFFYDEATFDDLGPPTIDEKQWGDFPGGRTLGFSGRTWRVKGPGFYGPGPSLFCDTAGCAWVDASSRLHLTVQKIGASWYSTEVVLEEALGYGDYVFTTTGDLDALHPNVVFGLFLWQYGACYDPANGWWNPYNEIDIEFSRWGNPGNDVGQYVAQPFDRPGNLHRFAVTFAAGERTSHAMRWLPDRVEYRSWRGGSMDESPASLIHAWTYAGPHVPRPEQPRVHVNLWQFSGPPATNQEVILEEFRFAPACLPPCVVSVPGGPPDTGAGGWEPVAWPNPFSAGTTIRYVLSGAGTSEVAIHDVAGRRVRLLSRGLSPAGEHRFAWDGRDDAGNPVAAGVYLYRLRAGDQVRGGRLVYLR
jgi:hypothetical protein